MKTPKNQYFLTAHDIMQIIGCKRSKAFNIVRDLNKELRDKGFQVVRGLVPTKFFFERFHCDSFEQIGGTPFEAR